MLNRIFAISKKELRQLRRDLRTLIIIFVFPVFMLVLFGYALSFDVENIQLGVYDQDNSDISREYLNSLDASGYFEVTAYYNSQQEVNEALNGKTVQCVVVFPKNLSEKFYNKQTVSIQYLVDGVDGNTATIVMNYVNAATRNLSSKYTNEFLSGSGIKIQAPVVVRPVFWYNPSLKTSEYLIPGLVSSLLITLSVILTAIAIVRERETGTIEQLNVSPATSFELMIGKIIPYMFISLVIATLILLFGYILFGVEIKGSIILLFISTLLYLLSTLSLGIFISTIAETQQVAFQMGIMISQLPANLLSGFIFPIESMPDFIRIMTNITPSKFYLVTLRAILIRGAGIEAFWQQWVYLGIFTILCLSFATFRTIKARLRD